MPDWNVVRFANGGPAPVVVSVEPLGYCETLAPGEQVVVTAAALEGFDFASEIAINECGGVTISASLFKRGDDLQTYAVGPMHIQWPSSEVDLLSMPPSFAGFL